MQDHLLSIEDAGSELSAFLASMTPGERIIICRQDAPLAEVRLLPANANDLTQSVAKVPRRLGLARGEFHVPDSFFEPLPDDLLNSFEGSA